MSSGPILIVDDEPSNLAAMRQALGPEFALVFATDGEAALAALDKHRPALVLLDVRMPDMDGYEVCRRIKANPATADTPVIFVTTQDELKDELTGFELGAVDYLTKPVHPQIVRARIHTHLHLVDARRLDQAYREAVNMLAMSGHYNDTDTGCHIWRMAAYAGALARAVGWSQAQCRDLEIAAPMHDTGKIGIPASILKKPGALSPDEWVVMRTHCEIGHAILSNSTAPVFRLAAEIALRHHEKWDGSGYPGGLGGDAIPESARIVAVADVFDALTMKRSYKEEWPVERAVTALQDCAGAHLDRRLVDRFVTILPEILDIKRSWAERESALAALAALAAPASQA